jgi:hypothetical protein
MGRLHRQEVIVVGIGKSLTKETVDLHGLAIHVKIELCVRQRRPESGREQ